MTTHKIAESLWVCPHCNEFFGTTPDAVGAHYIRCTTPETPMPPAVLGTPSFQSTFQSIFDEAFDLLVERQKKYGPENIRRLGLFGVFGRLSDDKIERVRRGMNGEIRHGIVQIEDFADFGDESFEDALFDIANYALIMIALKRGVWGRPLEQ